MSVESEIVVPSPVFSKENLFWNKYILTIMFYYLFLFYF